MTCQASVGPNELCSLVSTRYNQQTMLKPKQHARDHQTNEHEVAGEGEA